MLYLDGDSERITGIALLDGYREKVLLTTKCPVWLIDSPKDFDAILNEQLLRLKTEHLDFYLFHGMNGIFWDKVEALRLTDKMLAARQDGRIRHIGFSFHDNFEQFKKIIDCGMEWDACQIQLNYYDENFQAGLQGLQYANARGISVIIMEPLRGGLLANVPDRVKAVFDKTGKTPCEWALDYLWNRKEIAVTLSGMNSRQQVRDNIGYASRARAGMFSEDDEKIIRKAQDAFRSYHVIPCTGCAYCRPSCPENVAIPYVLSAYNNLQFHGNLKQAADDYKAAGMFGNKADACIECHQCENICPQHIEIVDWLKKIREKLENQGRQMKHLVKITVIKKECYKDLQEQYIANPKAGPCPYFEVGDEFILDNMDFFRMMNGKFCSEAWDAISRYIYTGIQGGSFMHGWPKDDNIMIACCSDGTRPVVFKLERIDEKQNF